MKSARRLIMLVDDSLTNLQTGQTVLSEEYTVMTVPSAQKMLEALKVLEWRKPELVLLDVDMPGMSGFEAIKILKDSPETRDIPVIFLTAMNESADELKGLRLGAVDYITKPFSPALLRQRIALHLLLADQKRTLADQTRRLRDYNDNLQGMVETKTKTILKLQNKILTAMAEMVEGRDGVTGNHIANTQRYLRTLLSVVIHAGIWPEESREWDIELLAQSSQLHDVGKISISDSVLKKPGKLTAEEFDEMKQHVRFGIGFLEKLEDGEEDSRFLQYAKTFAAFHHEKWDGSGYPHGLSKEDIPPLGRMMAIADVYDALTSVRPYKKAFSHEEAVRIIVKGRGTHFDPALVGLFEEVA
ncbi:MAG: response regulator, partial [Desulfovibrio sp.]|nr:response regulator [Desulfovibrio sp.]